MGLTELEQTPNVPPSSSIVIVAGEESGDKHAATLVTNLFKKNPNLKISGIGGNHMQRAGVKLLCDLASHSSTGLLEVVRHLPRIKKAIKQIKRHLAVHKPNLLILVDYPSFNLRLARYAKQKLGLKIIYYISPQIWAWNAKRIHSIRANIDHMAVILPFEKKIYSVGRVPVSFVGHPLVTGLIRISLGEARKNLGLPPNVPIIALLPGSRINEIKYHMPIFIAAMKHLTQNIPDIKFVIPLADSLSANALNEYIPQNTDNIFIVAGQAQQVLASADCAVVASGTASLECALLNKPMCIVYKSSWLTYLLAFKVLRVKYLGLCNLLLNKMLVPELLQYDCNVEELIIIIKQLLSKNELVHTMLNGFKELNSALSLEEADEDICNLVLRFLPN